MIMDKIDSRTLSVEALNERRRRAVKMRLEGVSLVKTAGQCEMSRTTVIAALKAYESGGWKAVDIARPGRPSGTGRTLTGEQEREVQRLICDRTPDQLKMDYALWSRQAVAELVRDRYGIKLPVRTMGLYLERWGFTPQKPMRKAYEQSPAAVQKWLDKEYLPSYSPELNPDEMANADLKQAVIKLAPARTKLQLVKATSKHLRSVQRQPERIKRYFEHLPVRYAA
jgi:transposase